MNEYRDEDSIIVSGLPANALVVPVILILAILHVIVIVTINNINSESGKLSAIMQDASLYTEEATSLIGASSMRSETCTNFVLMPVDKNGVLNLTSITPYAEEIGAGNTGSEIMERFRSHDVSDETIALLEDAAKSADNMLEAQLRAIALVNDVYPLPDTNLFRQLPLPPLSDKEKTYSDEEKLAAASDLLLCLEYGLNKRNVSEKVNACVASIRRESDLKAEKVSRYISVLRFTLWGCTIVVILVLLFAFWMLYRGILNPLNSFVKLIASDKPLDDSRGLREVRLLAGSYNGLLQRRDALDDILRLAAQTDTLTGLPNRYAFEKYVIESAVRPRKAVIVLFDVNYLKQTNDTRGHAAGDDLLKSAAECISLCFGAGDDKNCFRFGGDEFAAVLNDTDRDGVEDRIGRFTREQELRGISISWGYACTDDIRASNIKDLMSEADKNMYEKKEQMHRAMM